MKTLSTSLLIVAGLGLSSSAFAQQPYADQLTKGSCTQCHSSTPGNGGNVKAAVWAACPSGGQNGLTCLRNYVNSLTPPPPVGDTAPVLLTLPAQIDAEAGQPLKIALAVNDAEMDNFTVSAKPALGTSNQTVYPGTNNVPTIDYVFTPTTKQANKLFKFTFTAKETTSKLLTSNAVTTTVRVWPAGDVNDPISKFVVSAVSWSNGNLSLKGKVVLSKILTPSEKAAFPTAPHSLTVKKGKVDGGSTVGTPSVTLQSNLTWSATLPIADQAQVPCNVFLTFDQKVGSKKVGHALKTCSDL